MACKNCSKRHFLCHVSCEDYKEYQRKLEEIKEAKRLEEIRESQEIYRNMKKQKNGRSIDKRRRGY